MSAEKNRQETEDEAMNEFKKYHPIVNFAYFVLVLGFSMSFTHPICRIISPASGFLYSVVLRGGKKTLKTAAYLLPMSAFTAVLNPVFNHEGATVLCYFPWGNPLTLESVSYGISAAAVLVGAVYWFSCYGEIMTGDKLIYLFGRIFPTMSLVVSMIFWLVPKFGAQLKHVIRAQRCMGRDLSAGGIIKRAKCGMTILSVMVTWALESAVETADSMKARGYGLPGRTAFSVFTFDKRDAKSLLFIIITGTYTLAGGLCGGVYFRYFPTMRGDGPSVYKISVFASYLALCIYPVIIEIREERKWKALRSKI